jgi:hypothetical protein
MVKQLLRQATNILIKGNNTWLVSGGKKSRVLFARQGDSWTVLTLNCSRKSDDGILQQISMIPKLIYCWWRL